VYQVKKVLAVILCVALIMSVSIMGTLAYLTDRAAVTNTFTVGNVDIDLNEAKVNPDGTLVEGADRVTENTYHLIPGQTYVKDPTVTIKAGSEASYIRMLVTINYKSELDAIFAPGVKLDSIFNEWDSTTWIYHNETEDATNNTVTYEFRYKETIKPESTGNLALAPLFSSFTIPGSLTGEQLDTLLTKDTDGNIVKQLTITVNAHAIQAAGFDTADAAWVAFDAQMNA